MEHVFFTAPGTKIRGFNWAACLHQLYMGLKLLAGRSMVWRGMILILIFLSVLVYSGYKADLYPLREGDELRSSAFERRQKIDLGEPLGEV